MTKQLWQTIAVVLVLAAFATAVLTLEARADKGGGGLPAVACDNPADAYPGCDY